MSKRFQMRLEFYERQGGRCYYCGTLMYITATGKIDPASNRRLDEATFDHKIPMCKRKFPSRRGGLNQPKNIVLACRQCNMNKQNKTAEQYKQYLRGLAVTSKDLMP